MKISAPLFRKIAFDIGLELLITLSPIFAVIFIYFLKNRTAHAFLHEEWLFIAAVLFAQAAIRFMRAAIAPGRRNRSLLVLIVFLLVLGGLSPCSLLMGLRPSMEDEIAFSVASGPAEASATSKESDISPKLDTNRIAPAAQSQALLDRMAVQKRSIVLQWLLFATSIASFVWAAGVAIYAEETAKMERA